MIQMQSQPLLPPPQPQSFPKPFPQQEKRRRRMMMQEQLLPPPKPNIPFFPQPHCVADKSLMVNTSNFLYAIDYSVLIQMLQKQKNNIRKKKDML